MAMWAVPTDLNMVKQKLCILITALAYRKSVPSTQQCQLMRKFGYIQIQLPQLAFYVKVDRKTLYEVHLRAFGGKVFF
jgi:hypothetical protein